MRCLCVSIAVVVLLGGLSNLASAAEPRVLHKFDRVELTDVYYSEGANFGDIDGDGHMDAVHGPYWFAGPDFKTSHEIYPPKAQPRERYADNFFSWVYDFNGDGASDVFVVGFPGTPAYVYENPGKRGLDKHWTKHQVFDWVSNESPQFTQLVGDERPELVCTRDGYFGYCTIDWDKPFEAWTFHKVSEQIATPKFGHGLGIGDIDGDGRLDILQKDGWFQQPEELSGDPLWTLHKVPFAPPGGAEMYAYDVDGDGDNDVITSLSAHNFGLAWHEQLQDGERRVFRQHLIMGSKPEENRYGLVFSELHSVNLADIDGDGLKDIVTGKTYWSHHTQSPMWDAGAVVYWFRLVRGDDGSVDWVPYKADGDAGIGRQVIVGDINGDKLPDIVVGGMKGANVLIHRREEVDAETWKAAQPKPPAEMKDGLTPGEAAEHMTVPEGFRVKLAAGEPQVHQPIAMAFDYRGRLWVAEAYTYPIRAPEGEGKDKIIILEDTDGDGSLDSRKVFAEGLNLVSGLEVGFGGVWVGAAPYLMFIPDRDGDDRPDGEPEILLDGFGYQDTHETLNAFIWGPDGWLYGCHGVFTHSRVGKPGTPDAQRIPLNAGVWRYHPVRHEFEVFANGTSNPWGVDFNDHGHAFITACVIPHLWHVVQGAIYHRQGGTHFNPYVYDDIKTIADHAHYVGNIRDHAWWGSEPQAPADTLAAGGGHAHCGAMIYLGDNWPESYRGKIYFNNIHGNRVNCDVLERDGSGYVGHHGQDLLLANDHWHRGINLRYGPDGSVYLIDWYDKNACHRRTPEIWDRTNGRVFNISYGRPEPVKVDLSKLSDMELVELQLRKNDWYVRMSRRLLQERAAAGKLSADVHPALWKIVTENPDVTRKLRGIWVLHATGGLDEAKRRALLGHDSESIRAWAVQLEMEDKAAPADVLTTLVAMAGSDPSPLVRLYLASALQRLPLKDRWQLATELVKHAEDADDHNLPLVVWYGVEPLVPADPEEAMLLAATAKMPTVQRFIIRRAAAEQDGLELVTEVLAEAADAKTGDAETQRLLLDEVLHAFEGRVNIPQPKAWSSAYDRLAKSDDAAIRETADRVAVLLGDKRIFPRLRATLADDKAKLPDRQRALEILVRGRDEQAAGVLQQVLDVPALRGAAIRALSAHADPKTPAEILARYAQLTDDERRDAVATLVSRPPYALALLDAIEKKQVPRTDLHAYHVGQLMRFEDEALKARIKAVWGDVGEASADKQAKIAAHKSALTTRRIAAADLSSGRQLFNKTCANCHTLFGEGGKVGPDITGSNRADLDYILENIVAPSAVLAKDYRMTILQTSDGRAVSGLVQLETDSALTIRTINDTLVVAKADIEASKLSELSMMPDGLLDNLPTDEIRDLIGYLGSPTQVPLRGPAAPIDAKTGRVPGALEGETLKVLSRSAGVSRSQPMGNFKADRWSGTDQLWWTGAKPGAKLELELPVSEAGDYALEIVLTKARDYGIVQLALDGRELGGPIDLYNNPEVVTTGVLSFPAGKLTPGGHKLSLTIVGANEQAAPGYMVGIDYVRLVREE
jgi:putative membrane-bound dehydrogenase-like protein